MRTHIVDAILICLAAIPALAQDPVQVNPHIVKVEMENSLVRVLRIQYAPQETLGMHEHPARIAVWLTDGHTRATLPDGTTRELRAKAGEVRWAGPDKHAVENLSDSPMETIEIELKTSVPLTGPPVALDPVQLDPKHHRVNFENERVRVLRGTVGPHERTPLHEHPARVEIWLTDAQARATLENGAVTELDRKHGQVTWADPTRHIVENSGERPLEVIVVELKPWPAPLSQMVQLLTPSEGVDFGPYLAKLLSNVKRNWYALIPQTAKLGKKGEVVVTFQIRTEGTLQGLEIASGSGDAPLDRAAVAAIKSSAPFAPLPTSFHAPFIQLRLLFFYNLPKP